MMEEKGTANKKLLSGALLFLSVALIACIITIVILATRDCGTATYPEVGNLCSGSDVIDLAIIGAGIRGSFSSWRLRNNYSKISLFEYSNRIGGKIYTRKLQNGMNIEMGAMRFHPDKHQLITKLLTDRNMTFVPFPADHSPEHGVYYLHGTRHRMNNSITTSSFPGYQVRPDEMNKSFGEIVGMLLGRSVDLSVQNSTDSFDFITRTGDKLRDTGLWNLYGQYLSPAALKFITDMLPVEPSLNNNAAVLFGRLAAGDQGIPYSVPDGLQNLPEALVQEFLNARETYLKKINKDESLLRLTFDKTRSVGGQVSITEDEDHVCARRVLLTIPSRSLQLIDWEPFKHDPVLKSFLGSYKGAPAFKLFLGFSTPWWRHLADIREIVTDLPQKQTIEYLVQPDNSSIILVYLASNRVEYWKWLLQGGDIFGNNNGQYNVTQKLVDHALMHIAESMNISKDDIPEPTSGVVHLWQSDPIGPAWYDIRPGFDYRDIRDRMSKPDQEYEVYAATFGKYDDTHWIDGALKTSEYTLVKHFGMTPFQ